VWKDVAGERCRFSIGTGDAKRQAVPAIEHIEQMCETMHLTVTLSIFFDLP
jgi:enamine deaminase RidA (YjgF/YER057c/UK114 family)